MNTIVLDALIDSLRMVPFLLLIYFGIEWLEYRYGTSIQRNIQKAGKAGPLMGALFGSIPQCGFSVVGSALYTRRLVSMGTLLAVFLSTSDEAVPVILSQPNKMPVVVMLLATKIIIALIGGYGVDLLLRRSAAPDAHEHGHTCDHDHDHAHEEAVASIAVPDTADEEELHLEACCGHHVSEKHPMRELWLHPIRHTAQVFFFVFLVTLAINYGVAQLGGTAQLSRFLLHGSLWQPVLAAIVGLIPNCAASVAIAEVYMQHGISFGAAISGLCSSAGLGMLVLLKENHNMRDTLRVLLLLLCISIVSGIAIQIFYG